MTESPRRFLSFPIPSTSWTGSPGSAPAAFSLVAWICAGYFSVFIAVIGILGSVAGLMQSVLPVLSHQVWAVLVFVVMTVLLWRGLYQDLEKMVAVLVATFSSIAIRCLIELQGTPPPCRRSSWPIYFGRRRSGKYQGEVG